MPLFCILGMCPSFFLKKNFIFGRGKLYDFPTTETKLEIRDGPNPSQRLNADKVTLDFVGQTETNCNTSDAAFYSFFFSHLGYCKISLGPWTLANLANFFLPFPYG
jgi:hypothetical protein